LGNGIRFGVDSRLDKTVNSFLPKCFRQHGVCGPTFDILTGGDLYSNVEVPLTRQAVSAHLSIPREDEYQIDVTAWIREKPTLVPCHTRSVGTESRDWLLGMLGIVVVMTILGASIYSVLRYLL
jgi:hypothetical protein